jgi:hypothetical protein
MVAASLGQEEPPEKAGCAAHINAMVYILANKMKL